MAKARDISKPPPIPLRVWVAGTLQALFVFSCASTPFVGSVAAALRAVERLEEWEDLIRPRPFDAEDWRRSRREWSLASVGLASDVLEHRVRPGMPLEELVALIGPPTRVESSYLDPSERTAVWRLATCPDAFCAKALELRIELDPQGGVAEGSVGCPPERSIDYEDRD